MYGGRFFLKEIKVGIRSLISNKIRTLFSVLGILFGVAAVIAMLSVGEGAKEEVLALVKQLGTNTVVIRSNEMSKEEPSHPVEQKSKGLSLLDAEALSRNIPSLLRLAPLLVIQGESWLRIQGSPEILSTTRSFGEMKGLHLAQGRFLSDLDQKEKKLVCVLGSEVRGLLGNKGHVGNLLEIDGKSFVIVGVLESALWKKGTSTFLMTRNLNQAIFVPIGVLTRASSYGPELTEIILQIREEKEMDSSIQLVKNILKKLHRGVENYQVIVPKELLRGVDQTKQAFHLALLAIAGISLLVGGVGIMNIMIKIVSERTREIGIRRAVGASKQHILFQFILETTLLTVVGAILGIFFGIAISVSIAIFFGWPIVITFSSIALALGMSLIIGLCSGIYPAYLAAEMDPIKALRYDA